MTSTRRPPCRGGCGRIALPAVEDADPKAALKTESVATDGVATEDAATSDGAEPVDELAEAGTILHFDAPPRRGGASTTRRTAAPLEHP
jgi:hypothetical protein